MKKQTLLTFLLVLIGINLAVAQQALLPAVIDTLESPFRQTTDESRTIYDFSAEFTQLSAVVAIDRVQRGQGTVWFRFQPESAQGARLPMFRWDYREPEEQQILSDGATLWVYQQENRQVIVSDVRQVQSEYGDNPLSFFSDLGDLGRNFQIAWNEPQIDASGNYQLLLVPRNESRYFQQIVVVVSHKAVTAFVEGRVPTVFPLLATEVKDLQDNLTRITFNDVRWNLDLAPEHFVFEIPAGVEQVSPATDIGF